MQRSFPNPVELAKLMKFKSPDLNAKRRRLQSALTIYDLRTIAQRRTPKAAFDYTEGAAEGELSLARARQAFEDIEFHPGILRDVSALDTTTKILGGTSAMPFGIAPTGFTRLMQTEGEIELCIGQVQSQGLVAPLDIVAQHQGILDAAYAGDTDLAIARTREHIHSSRDKLLARYDLEHQKEA